MEVYPDNLKNICGLKSSKCVNECKYGNKKNLFNSKIRKIKTISINNINEYLIYYITVLARF